MIRDNARHSFDVARLGYLDWIDKDPLHESVGLQNAIVYGRAALNILSTLKAIYGERFTTWYKAIMQALHDDPLMAWYIELRNQVLKEGLPQMQVHGTMANMPDFFERIFADVPEGGVPFLMGEFGMGWYTPTDDGSNPEIHHFEITTEIQEEFGVSIQFPNTPTEHAGHPLTDRSARAVLLLCLGNIEDVLDAVDKQFTTVEA